MVNVDVSIVRTCLWRSDTRVLNVRVFIKRVFLLVRKLSMHVELILLNHVVSDIRVEGS